MLIRKILLHILLPALAWSGVAYYFHLQTRPVEESATVARLRAQEQELLTEHLRQLISQARAERDYQFDQPAYWGGGEIHAVFRQNDSITDLLSDQFHEQRVTATAEPFSELRARTHLFQLTRSANLALAERRKNVIACLAEKATDMGLRSDDIVTIEEQFGRLAYNEALPKLREYAVHNTGEWSELVRTLELGFYNRVMLQDRELPSMFTGRRLGCSFGRQFYSILVPEQTVVTQYEPLSVATYIGEFPETLNPKFAHLIVGSDTLKFGQDGVARFSVDTRRRGLHDVPVELHVVNPLTGETRVSESRTQYYVR